MPSFGFAIDRRHTRNDAGALGRRFLNQSARHAACSARSGGRLTARGAPGSRCSPLATTSPPQLTRTETPPPTSPKSENSCLENWLVTSAQQPDFQVSHPSSWVPERAEPSADSSGLHFRLTDPDETVLLGYLLVHAERKLSEPVVSKLAATTAAKIERSGITLLGSAHPITFEQDPRAQAVEGWLAGFRQDGKLGDAEIDVRFDFVERPNLVFTLLGFGPKRSDDVLTSLRVQRAYEIARATIKALEK
jgi:hypothetical protein